ncbi:HAMP domain-containing protein [Bacteroidetes/Chlorobi group bacterium MS-B_bin-24]|nr:MAG: HAMP domain-containing protein [Bacteroidetes/Chlorobi group bacterium MS-B_bin-24]
MRKYSTLVFSTFVAITFAFALMLAYQTLSSFKDFFFKFQLNELRKFNAIIASNLKGIIASGNFDQQEIDRFVKSVDSLLNLRITLVAPDGKVFAESRSDAFLLENHRNRPEIQQAINDGEGWSIRFSKTLNTDYIYFAKKINLPDSNYLILRVSLPKGNLNTFFLDLQRNITIIFVILFGSVVLLSYILSKQLTKPIIEVMEASKKVASGRFDIQLDERGETELALLKRNFNEMVSEMKRSFEELTEQRNFMKNLVESIDQAFAIINPDCSISFANQNYKNIILDDSHSVSFKDERISEQIKSAFENKSNSSIEIEIDNKAYISTVKVLGSGNQILHILYDISMLKKVENIKKDFVANVSHELRTPLTAIKGYIETLEEEVPSEQLRYIETIKKNTGRIIHIVDDLLTLMSLEDASSKLIVGEVDLNELINQIIPTFKHKLEEKNLKIEVICEPDFPKIYADAFRLEQVFINLVDNAIKYSEKGTIRIELSRKDEDTVKIIVSDEGIGIPLEHQDRIFERFYTVDKSHSRRQGGTGLGLSIVKHIILLHDGNIQVSSEPGKGTKFIIHLPIS